MRKTLIILICCTATLLVGYAGYRGYKVWRQSHFISLARGFLAKGDQRSAALSLQQALRTNPRNVEGTRLMADLMDSTHAPSALVWRHRVVELSPNTLNDRLALAQAAAMARDFISATNALAGVSAAGQQTAQFHNVAGAVWSSVGRVAEAERHFLEAARLDATNQVPRLNLAVIRLQSTNAQTQAAARSTLYQMCAHSVFRCQALRELLGDAVRGQQTNSAVSLARELMQQTNATFADRLLQLEVLRGTGNAEFKPALAACEQMASTNTATIYELGRWQIVKLGPSVAYGWLRTLPPKFQTNQPAALLLAECRLLMRDWRGLTTTIEGQYWEELEFIRHAFQAYALRQQSLAAASKGEWEMALKTSNDQKGALTMLLRLAAQWNWDTESEEILWSIVNRYPDEKWAFGTLSRALVGNGRTRPLMMLFSQELKRNPGSLSLKNNLAMTALLLDAQELKPYELAREVYQQSPTNAAFVSTYAFALHLQGKNAEALKALRALPAAQLEDPSVAGYYGLILKAAGDAAQAKAFLERSGKAMLLPEEKKLFEKAKAGA